MVVDRSAGGELWTPARRAEAAASRRAVHWIATRTLAVVGLQRNGVADVIDRVVAGQGILGRAGVTRFRGDHDDALAGGCTIDGCGGGALQYLDRLNVIWVDVGGAVGRHRAAGVRCGRKRRVVHRDSIDDEQRLAGRLDGAVASDLYVRRGARLSGLRRNDDVWRLGSQRVDDVGLVALPNQSRVDAVAYIPQLFRGARCSGAGYDDLTQLKWIER